MAVGSAEYTWLHPADHCIADNDTSTLGEMRLFEREWLCLLVVARQFLFTQHHHYTILKFGVILPGVNGYRVGYNKCHTSNLISISRKSVVLSER